MKNIVQNFLKSSNFNFKIDLSSFPVCYKVYFPDNIKVLISVKSFNDFDLKVYYKMSIKIIESNSIEKTEYIIVTESTIKGSIFLHDVFMLEGLKNDK